MANPNPATAPMRSFPSLLILAAVATVAAGQSASNQPPTTSAPETNAAAKFPLAPAASDPAAPSTPAAPTARPRAISPETAAKLSAVAPKFTPAKPVESKAAELVDLREIDKPRNGIIRLPQVMVQEQKLPILNDRELLTLSGQLELAYKRHPGLHLGSLKSASNNAYAMGMLAEERRLERMSEMSEIIGLYQFSDPKTGAALKTQANTVFLRSSEWVEGGIGHAGSHALSKLQ